MYPPKALCCNLIINLTRPFLANARLVSVQGWSVGFGFNFLRFATPVFNAEWKSFSSKLPLIRRIAACFRCKRAVAVDYISDDSLSSVVNDHEAVH